MAFTYIPNANNPVDAQPQLSSEIQFFCLLFHRRPSTIQNHTSKCDFQSLLVLVPIQLFDRLETCCIGCFASNRDHTICVAIQRPYFHLCRLTCTEKLRRKNKSVVPPSPFQHFNVGKTNPNVPHRHTCVRNAYMRIPNSCPLPNIYITFVCAIWHDNDRNII